MMQISFTKIDRGVSDMGFSQSVLSESVEHCQAAVEWSKIIQERKIKGDEISKQLMQKYTPLILERDETKRDK